jgi:hypothetical protein
MIVLASLATPRGAVISVSVAGQKLNPCEKTHIALFVKKPGHKAAATTGGRLLSMPNTSCGFGYGGTSKQAAIATALRYCRIYAKRNNRRAPCKVIEVK